MGRLSDSGMLWISGTTAQPRPWETKTPPPRCGGGGADGWRAAGRPGPPRSPRSDPDGFDLEELLAGLAVLGADAVLDGLHPGGQASLAIEAGTADGAVSGERLLLAGHGQVRVTELAHQRAERPGGEIHGRSGVESGDAPQRRKQDLALLFDIGVGAVAPLAGGLGRGGGGLVRLGSGWGSAGGAVLAVL